MRFCIWRMLAKMPSAMDCAYLETSAAFLPLGCRICSTTFSASSNCFCLNQHLRISTQRFGMLESVAR